MPLRPNICDHPAPNGEPLGENPTLTSPISPDGTPCPGERYLVPARQGRAVRLRAGQAITVINTHGTQVCDFWAFSAANPDEFLSWEHARAWINAVLPRPGQDLATNRRRPILRLEEDTSPGVHDTLIAACDLFLHHAGLHGLPRQLRGQPAPGAPGDRRPAARGAAALQSLDEHPRRPRLEP